MTKPRKPNRLINETSPYLLQHARNPVDWYPWGPEALDRACSENKLILLSIGYSACHWCHVMERESFENAEVAELMNELYVCIKVDREERPDLDKIYQASHQIFQKRPGGWPLTVFVKPHNLMPIFVGTYFPPADRGGMIGFSSLLQRIQSHYADNKDQFAEAYPQIKEAVTKSTSTVDRDASQSLRALPELCVRELKNAYDPVHGGFSSAPKFPLAAQIAALVQFSQSALSTARMRGLALQMAEHTLEAMANGGIQDHIGGGFCRYSVDERWEIPHFEKMLYDNAALLPLYAQAARICARREFEQVALDMAQWVVREMQSPEGGYYSAFDADSEGEEGKFYVWTAEAIQHLLTDEEFGIVNDHFGLDGAVNFEGKWHLRVETGLEDVARSHGVSIEAARNTLQSAKTKLFGHRSRRVAPDRDDKILVSWNGLMIRGMAAAAWMLGRPEFLDSAEKAVSFIRETMWKNGRLKAVAKDGKARFNAYLDDYIFLAAGLLELLQARWRSEDLAFAIELVDAVLKHFRDENTGLLFFTSDDHEDLLVRITPTYDDATPSGNGLAAHCLIRLGYVLGNTAYVEAGEKILHSLHATAEAMPTALGTTMCAIIEKFNPGTIVILRGKREQLKIWQQSIANSMPLTAYVLAIPDHEQDLPESLTLRKPVGGSPVGYVCKGHVCSAPFDSLEPLIAHLAENDALQH